MENTYEKRFAESLKKYVDEKSSTEGKGFITRLAKTLRTSQGQLSNILRGERPGTETWRRFVSETIGIEYDVMIGIKPKDKPQANGNVIAFPVECKPPPKVDKRLSDMRDALDTIYRHGTDDIKSAIEMNLKSFKATVELSMKVITLEDQMAEKNGDILSMKEEIEILKKKINDTGG